MRLTRTRTPAAGCRGPLAIYGADENCVAEVARCSADPLTETARLPSARVLRDSDPADEWRRRAVVTRRLGVVLVMHEAGDWEFASEGEGRVVLP